MGNKEILILSHTPHDSIFKIGSHHYANQLHLLGYHVSFFSTPRSLLHRLIKGKNSISDYNGSQLIEGIYKLNINTVLPITIKPFELISCINYIASFHDFKKLPHYDLVICDQAFFYPYLKFFKFKKLIYRPTDIYADLVGERVFLVEKEIVKLATKVIATSNVVAEYISDKYGINDVGVVSNGYDSDCFINFNMYERHGFVYVGSLDKRFDFDILCKMSKAFPNEKFDIFGPLDNLDVKVVESISSDCKNVSFKGGIDYRDVPNVLNQYRFGLLPFSEISSNFGRSPMKLFEYLACGLEVLYSNIDSKEVVINATNIISIIDNPESLYSLHNHNLDLSDYSWDRKAKNLISCIEGF